MIIKRMFRFIALALLSATAVTAQIDPDVDGIGIYADLGGLERSIDVLDPANFDLYVLATRISGEGIMWWEASLDVDPGLVVYHITFPEGTDMYGFVLDQHTLGGMNHVESEYFIGSGDVIHLATLHCAVVDTDPKHIWFDVGGGGEVPGYTVVREPGAEFIPLNPSSGGLGIPAFTVNGVAPIANEDASWSDVKSLFR